MKRIVHHVNRLFRGVTVYALVGKPGTGKSFRAKLVAEKFGIDFIVDDGLVIKDNKILSGQSAKKEKKLMTAIKTAIFTNPEKAREARKALQKHNAKQVLLLGTSDRMVHKIAHRLKLPPPVKIININDVATKEEIAEAQHARYVEGKHIIPVPAVEVKRDHGHIFFDSIKFFVKRRIIPGKKNSLVEKSIVRPVYSQRGTVRVSEEAISQMVVHCLQDYEPSMRINKVIIGHTGTEYDLEVVITLPVGMAVSSSYYTLQESILTHIEKFAGISISAVHITIGKFYKPGENKDS